MEKTIYELELHESFEFNRKVENGFGSVTCVTRVAGGWIYTSKTVNGSGENAKLSESSVFVKFDKEFFEEPDNGFRATFL